MQGYCLCARFFRLRWAHGLAMPRTPSVAHEKPAEWNALGGENMDRSLRTVGFSQHGEQSCAEVRCERGFMHG